MGNVMTDQVSKPAPLAIKRMLGKLQGMGNGNLPDYKWPIQAPSILPGVVPADTTAPVVMACDSAYCNYFDNTLVGGFPGFQYLSQLAMRAEYRAFASTLSTEITRKGVTFTSTQTDDTGSSDKLKKLDEEFKRLGVLKLLETCVQHDSYFGRAQIFLDLKDQDIKSPLILSPHTVPVGSLKRLTTVEAVWTTPKTYSALNPAAPDFYRPTSWFMMGQEVHSSRLLTVVTRPLPDILKPAFNFAGMSLSQLAQPYVDNWLRTRQSVGDLISNFSITALATSMDQVLQDGDDGADVFARAKLFTATRDNANLMLLDKEREELVQVNTPLAGLHELQAQAQEHMCSVSRIPAIVLTGISPSGLNATSDGEIRVFNDWIAAQQTAYWREPLEIISRVMQLSLFGEIDPHISFTFNPLYQMTEKELAEIREVNARVDAIYLDHSVIDQEEVRQRLADDADSGYNALDLTKVIEPPADDPGGIDIPGLTDDLPEPGAKDAQPEFKEADHPRATNGQFGSGGGGSTAKGGKKKSEKKPHSTAGYTDRNGNARSPGLDKSERAIEGKFYGAINKNAPKLMDNYRAKFGNTIDPDLVKQMSPEFAKDPNLAAAVHEPSSKLAKMIYADALKRKADAGDTSPTVFTAGGSGSGKSTTMGGALSELGAEPGGLLYDSVLSNPTSAKSRIDQALNATDGPVGIAYTNADIKKALMLNALRTRSVSIDTLMHAHVGASDTIRELAEHYKDNPRVKIVVMNNRGGIGDVAKGDIGDVPTYEPQALRRQLVGAARKLLQAGKIDKNKYDLLVK